MQLLAVKSGVSIPNIENTSHNVRADSNNRHTLLIYPRKAPRESTGSGVLIV